MDNNNNSTEMRLSGILTRLETVLETENARIGTDPAFDVKASNAQKSRCLYELNLLFRSVGEARVPPSFQDRLRSLRTTLQTNSTRVKAHLDAVKGVTDLINEAMQAAEADGTYSIDQFRHSAAR